MVNDTASTLNSLSYQILNIALHLFIQPSWLGAVQKWEDIYKENRSINDYKKKHPVFSEFKHSGIALAWSYPLKH